MRILSAHWVIELFMHAWGVHLGLLVVVMGHVAALVWVLHHLVWVENLLWSSIWLCLVHLMVFGLAARQGVRHHFMRIH